MPAVLVGIAAIGVALLLLLVAYALTVLFTPIIEGLLREIPFIGGVLARKAKAALDWAGSKILAYTNTGVHLVTGWFKGMADAYQDFVDAVNAFIVDLPAKLDHLVHVTVHDIVKAFVNPVRDLVHAAQADATDALAKAEAIADLPLSHFKGIDHGVTTQLDHLRDIVENVDLPDLHRTLDRAIQRAADAAAADVSGLGSFVDDEFAKVWGFLGDIPLQKLLELLTAVPALALLVQVITSEAGLDTEACRSKVKGICSADPGAWAALLDIAGAALLWMGLREFVQLTQDFARETLPTVLEMVRGN